MIDELARLVWRRGESAPGRVVGDEFLEHLDLWLDGIAIALRGALHGRQQLAVHDQRDHQALTAFPSPLDPVLVDLDVGRVVEGRPAAEPELLLVGGLGHRPGRGRQRAVAEESAIEQLGRGLIQRNSPIG